MLPALWQPDGDGCTTHMTIGEMYSVANTTILTG